MKTKLLLLMLLAGVGYLGFEQLQGREPVARIIESAAAMISGQKAKPAPVVTATPDPAASDTAPAAAAREDVLVLSAPPRDGAEGGIKRFGPIADYLSAKLGRKVVYKHPVTWGGYQSDMQNNAYDIVFDGPHFVSWRIENQKHNVLVKLPGEPLLVVGFVRADNKRVNNVGQLVGQTICAHAPPNLGLLSVQNELNNPSRQPNYSIMEGFGDIYQGVIDGKCVAGIVPKKNLRKRDPENKMTRVIYEHSPFPEQAFTAGPRLSRAEQAKVAEALTSPEAETVLASFREAYAYKGPLIVTANSEYSGFAVYLKPVQGFYPETPAVAAVK